jgi:hypothetical protein
LDRREWIDYAAWMCLIHWNNGLPAKAVREWSASLS